MESIFFSCPLTWESRGSLCKKGKFQGSAPAWIAQEDAFMLKIRYIYCQHRRLIWEKRKSQGIDRRLCGSVGVVIVVHSRKWDKRSPFVRVKVGTHVSRWIRAIWGTIFLSPSLYHIFYHLMFERIIVSPPGEITIKPLRLITYQISYNPISLLSV